MNAEKLINLKSLIGLKLVQYLKKVRLMDIPAPMREEMISGESLELARLFERIPSCNEGLIVYTNELITSK